MSWFDTSGLASLAKNALKEAQKTIDKALDIKDDDLNVASTATTTTTTTSLKINNLSPQTNDIDKQLQVNMKHSISNPTISTINNSLNSNNNSIWGSFTGSFFDNQQSFDKLIITSTQQLQTTTITTSPTSSSSVINKYRNDDSGDSSSIHIDNRGSLSVDKPLATDSTKTIQHRLSLISESGLNSSESVEVLSTPTTPGSSLTSPSQQSNKTNTIAESESVEIIRYDTAPTTSDLITPDSSASLYELSENFSTEEQHEPITNDNIDEDISIEDDSVSYNTVSADDSTPITVMEPDGTTAIDSSSSSSAIVTTSILPITRAPSRSTGSLLLSVSQSQLFSTDKNQPQLNESVESGKDTTDNLSSPHHHHHHEQQQQHESVNDGKTSNLIEDAMLEKSIESYESQTQFSDSTQSFEDIHQTILNDPSIIVTTTAANSNTNKNNTINKINKTNINENDNGNNSTNSSDDHSISDLVKITHSEETSGHTSGDEIDTATSSDIEIISSPNGDSSSTNSIYHVRKPSSNYDQKPQCSDKTNNNVTKKGHCRELSTTSTHSIQSNASDDSHLSGTESDTDKLLRRISELSEILEAREFRLLEMGRENADLHEKNADMKLQLDLKNKHEIGIEMSNVTEEYTQRLSALEKKFQQTIRERDHLRNQLKHLQNELSEKISKEDVDKLIGEKDYMVKELKNEGEKLSKQILHHSNIIKKLRTKEKDSDVLIKRQKDQIDELLEETERLKKSLSAKDEVERSQIEAVNKLSAERKQLDKDNQLLRSRLDDLQQKLKTVQQSFEVARKEVTDKQSAHLELQKRNEIVTTLENERSELQLVNQQLINDVNTIREKLKLSDLMNNQKEQKLRIENTDLLRRLEEAEYRAEENANSITQSTIPLIKQLEALQATLNTRTLSWERQEKQLLDQLDEAQQRLTKLNSIEKTSHEQTQLQNIRSANLEERLTTTLLRSEQLASQLQQCQVEYELHEKDYKLEIEKLKLENQQNKTLTQQYCGKIEEIEKQLMAERESFKIAEKQRKAYEFENKLKYINQSQPKDMTTSTTTLINDQPLPGVGADTGNISPTLSVGRLSIADSISSNVWQIEDGEFMSGRRNYGMSSSDGGGGGAGGGSGSVYESNNFNLMPSTSVLENLQSHLKQKDGENHQLQWELSRLQTDRNFFMSEVSNLTEQLDNLKEKLSTNETIGEQFKELQQQYDALLQMYGEKVEETQELKLDLQDVKEMYKAQIDDLLKQQKDKL